MTFAFLRPMGIDFYKHSSHFLYAGAIFIFKQGKMLACQSFQRTSTVFETVAYADLREVQKEEQYCTRHGSEKRNVACGSTAPRYLRIYVTRVLC